MCVPTVVITMTTEFLSNMRYDDEFHSDVTNLCPEHYMKKIKDALQQWGVYEE